MEGIKQKITSKVTGDAYDKPAQTKDGAMTTQDSPDAVTTKDTSAEGKGSKLDQAGQAGEDKISSLGKDAQNRI
ncbi:hypothetical protein H2200_012897 [Cladophialophora chaetospira]|uniref:Uncharacterized protein n=1 Tax=Cladophialophora chaetospira TaxID=386627 RepID=A0AA39CBZ5_9EURO|nr:hypothetical protein H2200_012897 [Cladophialophora chaetospira]